MSISITVNFSAGDDICDCFQEATELANKLNIMVEFKFNQVTCFTKPNGSIRRGVYEYHEAIKSGSKYQYARNY